MNTTKVSAVEETAIAASGNTSAPKYKWLATGSHYAKKAVMMATIAGIMVMTGSIQAFAEGEATGAVDTSSFITTACTVLKSVICLIGGGVGVWGIVNLLEGYGNDNPGAKAQ